jgi:hypothetical protein
MKITNIEDLDITITPRGIVDSPWDDSKRPVVKWLITLKGQGFMPMEVSFYTGLGCRPDSPTKIDVLRALLSDAEAGTTTFENWCADFGYSSDSIKALRTYEACVRTYQDLILQFGLDGLDDIRNLIGDET